MPILRLYITLCGCAGAQQMTWVCCCAVKVPWATYSRCFRTKRLPAPAAQPSEPQEAAPSEVSLSEWGKFFQALPRISKGRFTVERTRIDTTPSKPWWTLFKTLISSSDPFTSAKNNSPAWRLTLVIPVLRRPREGGGEFEVSLGYLGVSWLKI